VERPKQASFGAFGKAVTDLGNAIYRFIDAHKEMELTRYGDILAETDIEWSTDSMRNADASLLDGRTVMAEVAGASVL